MMDVEIDDLNELMSENDFDLDVEVEGYDDIDEQVSFENYEKLIAIVNEKYDTDIEDGMEIFHTDSFDDLLREINNY